MRTILIVLLILAVLGIIFGWLLAADAETRGVAEFISEWSRQFLGAE